MKIFKVIIEDVSKIYLSKMIFEITIQYESVAFYHDVHPLIKEIDRKVKLFGLIKELLERINISGQFEIEFAHFSDKNPKFNLTLAVI